MTWPQTRGVAATLYSDEVGTDWWSRTARPRGQNPESLPLNEAGA